MPRDTKKRKLNETGKTAGSTPPAKDIKDLKKAISKCDPAASLVALSNSLDDASPETIEMLKAVLVPVLQTDNSPKHCVRCHQTYRESTNKIGSCAIKHTEPYVTRGPDPNHRKPHYWVRTEKYSCCNKEDSWSIDEYDSQEEEYSDGYDYDDQNEDKDGEEPRAERKEPNYGVCFTAKHTTDPTSVKYHSSYGEKKLQEKGVDYSGRNANVRTCKMMGCGNNQKSKKK
ncbi:hypothetical protein RhiJN_25897 [Ceratobasidium sp. AG-Ba]|nr:hypothetical protein RhiJN_25897 [Ceratobasidium sp. AG-Ba]